jgi:hypothetical protein
LHSPLTIIDRGSGARVRAASTGRCTPAPLLWLADKLGKGGALGGHQRRRRRAPPGLDASVGVRPCLDCRGPAARARPVRGGRRGRDARSVQRVPGAGLRGARRRPRCGRGAPSHPPRAGARPRHPATVRARRAPGGPPPPPRAGLGATVSIPLLAAVHATLQARQIAGNGRAMAEARGEMLKFCALEVGRGTCVVIRPRRAGAGCPSCWRGTRRARRRASGTRGAAPAVCARRAADARCPPAATQSCVDPSFWSELAARKLDEYKLSEAPVDITGVSAWGTTPASMRTRGGQLVHPPRGRAAGPAAPQLQPPMAGAPPPPPRVATPPPPPGYLTASRHAEVPAQLLVLGSSFPGAGAWSAQVRRAGGGDGLTGCSGGGRDWVETQKPRSAAAVHRPSRGLAAA